MGQTRFGGSFGDNTEYDYVVEDARQLVENDFDDFSEAVAATSDVLKMLSTDVVDVTPVTTNGYENYSIVDVNAIGTERKVRPVNTNLFIQSVTEFEDAVDDLMEVFAELARSNGVSPELESKYPEFVSENRLNETLYTIAQGVGIGLDALSSSKNKARKHAGLRFESLIEVMMNELGISNDNHYFKIPIEDTGDSYRCEVDMLFGPHDSVATTKTSLDADEIVVSIKTTSKDRMTKIFTDKVLMSQFLNQEIPMMALFLHDVQRKGQDGINSTFVSNNYYIYHEYLTDLEGTYFIDPPSKIEEEGFSDKLDTYRELILEDVWEHTHLK